MHTVMFAQCSGCGLGLPGQAEGDGRGSSVGSQRNVDLPCEAPGHKVFNIMFESGIYPLEESWMTWPLAQRHEDSLRQRRVCSTFVRESSPRQK